MRFLRFSSLAKPFRQLLRVQMTLYRRNNFCCKIQMCFRTPFKNFHIDYESRKDFGLWARFYFMRFLRFSIPVKPFRQLLRVQMTIYRRNNFCCEVQTCFRTPFKNFRIAIRPRQDFGLWAGFFMRFLWFLSLVKPFRLIAGLDGIISPKQFLL